MENSKWADVDDYLCALLVPQDDALAAVRNANAAARLPAIDVSANQGKFLMLLAKLSGARSVLELGTLGGYSTIWLARGLPDDGRVITLEASAEHAAVARANIDRAGVGDRVDIRVAPALETLPVLVDEGRGPFDLVFIDADKPNTPHYLEWALRLTAPGSVIVVDNVVREGFVADSDSHDESVRGIRACLEMMASDPRLDATALQTVGSKGWDGFALAIVA